MFFSLSLFRELWRLREVVESRVLYKNVCRRCHVILSSCLLAIII